MARDFIYIDSDKVKETLKNALEMGEGDLSGNKLGLSSKVVPVVSLNRSAYLQADIDFPDTVVVQNTWYTVCDLSGALKIHMVGVRMDTAAEDVEVEWTVDSVAAMVSSFNAAIDTWYTIYKYAFGTGLTSLSSAADVVLALKEDSLECNKFKMRIRKTSAVGANHLHARVIYSKW